MTYDISAEETEGFRYNNSGRYGQYVTILDANGIIRQINLEETGDNEFLFGRSTKDIQLSSPIVSRIHGRFFKENGIWCIEDLNSKNGILYNGNYVVKKQHILDGDVFRIDNTTEQRTDGVLFLISADLPDAGWVRYPLTDTSRITIGRSKNNTIVLPSASVSRLHASVYTRNNKWYIRNENSENGLLLNDVYVNKAQELHEKDIITIISSKLIFTTNAVYVCSYNNGISVAVRDAVVIRHDKEKGNIVTADHVSMSISPGELVAIIGGSGAGKSTIMSVMCGYLKPKQGNTYINGSDLYKNFDVLKKCFGYVPQSDIVYDNLTLYDMLKYTAELRLPKDTTEAEREKAIQNAIDLVELKDKKNSLIKKLSGGQKKRASIAVELLSDPKLLFLDEPASGLDPATERSLMASLKKMTRAGKTVILVTHSTLQLKMCDKIAFMGKGGRLCYFGNENDSLEFFAVRDIVDVYSMITKNPEEWRIKYETLFPRPVDKPVHEQKLSVNDDTDRERQLLVLCRRYIKLMLNDKIRLIVLIAQAPVLAALIRLVANGEQFRQYEMTKSLLFALSCSGFWVGMFNSVQEICKERTILKREFMTGLSLTSYIFSKVIVLGALCLVQCVLLIAVFAILVGLPNRGVIMLSLGEMLITAWLTAMAASTTGLFVSSLFNNPDKAMTTAPLLLMPQMLFSGLLFKLSGVTTYISWFTVCRWSMEGYGTISDLNSLTLALQQQGMPLTHEPEQFFERASGHLLYSWALLIGFCVVFICLSRITLIRIRKAD